MDGGWGLHFSEGDSVFEVQSARGEQRGSGCRSRGAPGPFSLTGPGKEGLDLKCHVHCTVLAQCGHPGQLSTLHGNDSQLQCFHLGKGTLGRGCSGSPQLRIL